MSILLNLNRMYFKNFSRPLHADIWVLILNEQIFLYRIKELISGCFLILCPIIKFQYLLKYSFLPSCYLVMTFWHWKMLITYFINVFLLLLIYLWLREEKTENFNDNFYITDFQCTKFIFFKSAHYYHQKFYWKYNT